MTRENKQILDTEKARRLTGLRGGGRTELEDSLREGKAGTRPIGGRGKSPLKRTEGDHNVRLTDWDKYWKIQAARGGGQRYSQIIRDLNLSRTGSKRGQGESTMGSTPLLDNTALIKSRLGQTESKER